MGYKMSLTWLMKKCLFQVYNKGSLRSYNERGWSSVQDRHPIARGSVSVLMLARGSSPNTCYTHCTGSTQRCHITLQLVHMLHSLYYPILTALHKDAMLYNGIVPGSLGPPKGMGTKGFHNHLEGPQLTPLLENIFALTVVPVFTTPKRTTYIPRHLSVCKGI